MNNYFRLATLNYYLSLALAITVNPNFLIFTALMFLVIPSDSQVELIPGTETVLEAQIELFKTQYWLSKNGYHESI